ncbi:hypothetical protein SAMN05216490_3393 [Mucilaginibacter mallensis]|uniref:Uncharacterized protein n=1 Tax=Mucilaginibacter mallensis TaxID=652787 RepID=A0A1H2A7C4_MUCMA|nr:hypothetical protein SAMN05216490_3393 [Mucilaginibacter mallensis]
MQDAKNSNYSLVLCRLQVALSIFYLLATHLSEPEFIELQNKQNSIIPLIRVQTHLGVPADRSGPCYPLIRAQALGAGRYPLLSLTQTHTKPCHAELVSAPHKPGNHYAGDFYDEFPKQVRDDGW